MLKNIHITKKIIKNNANHDQIFYVDCLAYKRYDGGIISDKIARQSKLSAGDLIGEKLIQERKQFDMPGLLAIFAKRALAFVLIIGFILTQINPVSGYETHAINVIATIYGLSDYSELAPMITISPVITPTPSPSPEALDGEVMTTPASTPTPTPMASSECLPDIVEDAGNTDLGMAECASGEEKINDPVPSPEVSAVGTEIADPSAEPPLLDSVEKAAGDIVAPVPESSALPDPAINSSPKNTPIESPNIVDGPSTDNSGGSKSSDPVSDPGSSHPTVVKNDAVPAAAEPTAAASD